VDNQEEANKVLSQAIGGTLYTIAKDVKLQLDFNPQLVDSYRLIGYENRLLRQQDFKNDAKDAGELGAGMSVTALYEVIPKRNAALKTWASVHLRYKKPDEEKSISFSQKIDNQPIMLEKTSIDFRFAAAVAGWGQLLRHSKFKGDFNFQQISELALGAIGNDPDGYRIAFVQLVQQCLKWSAKK
jgi:Ca-activated chloride channel family protein